jgi:Ca2+-binding EF-hand superfamily protein
LFDRLDVNRSGSLDFRELGDLATFVNEMNRGGNPWQNQSSYQWSGGVQRESFVTGMKQLLKDVFDSLDRDRSGTLSQPELRELERAFQLDSAGSLIRQMEQNANWQVTFQHFVEFLANHAFASMAIGGFRNAMRKVIELATFGGSGANGAYTSGSYQNSGAAWGSMDQKVDSLFNLMDVNRSGTLEMVELGDLGQVIQREWSQTAWYSEFARKCCPRGDWRLSKREFSDLIMGILGRAYDALDVNRDGVVDSHELRRLAHAFAACCSRQMTDRINQTIQRFDRGVRRTDFYDFVLSEFFQDASRDIFHSGMVEIIRLGAPNPQWQPQPYNQQQQYPSSAPVNNQDFDFPSGNQSSGQDFRGDPGRSSMVSDLTFSETASPVRGSRLDDTIEEFNFD